MNGSKLIISKNSDDRIIKIHSNENKNRVFEIKLPDSTGAGTVNAASELLRFVQGIEENIYTFIMETSYVTENKIPVINLIPQKREDEKLPIIFFIHGFETSKEKVLRYAIHYAAAGFYTVLADLPEHGERMTPDFDIKYKLNNDVLTSGLNRLNLFKKSFDEIKTIITHYLSEPLIDINRIGISGISMGATVALLETFTNPWIKAASPFLSIVGFDKIPDGHNIVLSEENKKFINSIDPIQVLNERPEAAVLAQFGKDDEITENESLPVFEKKMKTLYAEVPDRFKLVRHPGIKHDVSPAMIKNSVEWFKKFL